MALTDGVMGPETLLLQEKGGAKEVTTVGMVDFRRANNLILLWPRLFEGRVIDMCSDADNSRGDGNSNYAPGGGFGAGHYGNGSGDGDRNNNQHIRSGNIYYGGKRN